MIRGQYVFRRPDGTSVLCSGCHTIYDLSASDHPNLAEAHATWVERHGQGECSLASRQHFDGIRRVSVPG